MVARLVRDQKVVGSSPVTSTKTIARTFVLAIVFLFGVLWRDLRVGGDCGSNRFAFIGSVTAKVERKLNSTVRCSLGRAAKGASPVTSTKNHSTDFRYCDFLFVRFYRDLRGGKKNAVFRRSADSTADLTALGLGCQPCAPPKAQVPKGCVFVTTPQTKKTELNTGSIRFFLYLLYAIINYLKTDLKAFFVRVLDY